jgi:hypothetical protein
MTRARKKQLFELVIQIGMRITTLEEATYTEQVAIRQVNRLRASLEQVRAEIIAAKEEA